MSFLPLLVATAGPTAALAERSAPVAPAALVALAVDTPPRLTLMFDREA